MESRVLKTYFINVVYMFKQMGEIKGNGKVDLKPLRVYKIAHDTDACLLITIRFCQL